MHCKNLASLVKIKILVYLPIPEASFVKDVKNIRKRTKIGYIDFAFSAAQNNKMQNFWTIMN